MAKKGGLGKGLGALIDDAQYTHKSTVKRPNVNEISIDNIDTNPFQPRASFNEEALNELAESIKELGIIQPITVRKIEATDNLLGDRIEKYQLISGERRLRASKIAGLKAIPAFIRESDDQGMLEMALVENIQRDDLNAIEIAISYQRLMEECALTQENMSKRVGKQRSSISNYLRLLKLPAEIQASIRDKQLSFGHARAFVTIEDATVQLQLFYKVLQEKLSVRKTEELAKEINEGKIAEKKKETTKIRLPERFSFAKDKLSNEFGAKVGIKRNVRGQGSISIAFKSDDEFERLLAMLEQNRNTEQQ